MFEVCFRVDPKLMQFGPTRIGSNFSEMRYRPKEGLLSFHFDSIADREAFEAGIPEDLKELVI